jgi:citrate lyase subunit beta/citryl-CoA lyase
VVIVPEPSSAHPREVLLGAQAAAAFAVCDHYSGVEARMRKKTVAGQK